MNSFIAQTATSIVALLMISSSLSAQDRNQVENNETGILLEGIVVTGELLDRSLSKTGNSVVILDEKELNEKAGVESVRDALGTVPNVSVITGTAKAPTIRGVDGTGPAENANAFFAGSRARLNWQIDGRPASYNEVVFGDFGIWDLDRIEILRGPQSTLVGRNSIAGTVIVKTKDPTFEKESAFQAAAGNYNQRRASAMINAPIINNFLALRLTADWQGKSSSVNYEPFANISDPGEIEALSFRGKLLLLPRIGIDTRLLLTFAHQKYKSPQGEIVVRPFEDRISNFSRQPVHKPSSKSIGAEFETTLANNLKLEASMSATDFSFKREAGTSEAKIDKEEFVFEPRLRYKNSDGYQGVLGIHYFLADQNEYINFINDNNFKDKTDTFAVYAEGVIPLTEKIDMSLGLRYEREKRDREGGDDAGAIINIAQKETYEALLPKLGFTWSPDHSTSWGVQVSRGYNAGGGGVASSFPSPFPLTPYEYTPEYVWTYELFGRQKFSGNRIQTTQNIFFSDYKDMQLPFDLTPDDSRDEAFVVRNADKVITYGAEFGIKAEVTDKLTLDGGLGLLWTDIISYPNSGVEGNKLFTAPNITATVGLTWKDGNWRINANGKYTDAYFTDINNRARGKTDPYFIANTELAYTYKNLELFGTVNNVFDTETPIALYPGSDPSQDSAVLTHPRTFLIGVKARY